MKEKKKYDKTYKIQNIESKSNKLNLSIYENKTKRKVLLILIFSLTFLDLLFYFTQSFMAMFYIPIAIIVFILLFLYHQQDNLLLSQMENQYLISYKTKPITTFFAQDIKELRCKNGKINILFEDDTISFDAKDCKEIFNKLKEGFKNNGNSVDR